MMAYSGEKPHKCYLCKYSASLEGNLKQHIYADIPPVIYFNIFNIPQIALIILETKFEFNSVYKGTTIYTNMH